MFAHSDLVTIVIFVVLVPGFLLFCLCELLDWARRRKGASS